jgi:hypothetical protein
MSPSNPAAPSTTFTSVGDNADKQFLYDFHLLSDYLNVLREKLRIAVVFGGDKRNDEAVIYKTHNPRYTEGIARTWF